MKRGRSHNRRYFLVSLLLLSLLILPASLASAGWFSDLWSKVSGNKITGNAISPPSKTVTLKCGSPHANDGCKIKFTGLNDLASASATFRANGDFDSPYECIRIKVGETIVSGPHCKFEKDKWRTLNSNVNVLNKISSDGSLEFFCNTYGSSGVNGYTCEITLTYTPKAQCTSFNYTD